MIEVLPQVGVLDDEFHIVVVDLGDLHRRLVGVGHSGRGLPRIIRFVYPIICKTIDGAIAFPACISLTVSHEAGCAPECVVEFAATSYGRTAHSRQLLRRFDEHQNIF